MRYQNAGRMGQTSGVARLFLGRAALHQRHQQRSMQIESDGARASLGDQRSLALTVLHVPYLALTVLYVPYLTLTV